MTKRKDKERVETQGPHRDGRRGTPPAPEGKKWIKCLFPPCQYHILVDDISISPLISSQPQQMQIPMCEKHLELLNFVIWAMTNIRVEPGRTPSGVITPGHQQFKAPAPQEEPK